MLLLFFGVCGLVSGSLAVRVFAVFCVEEICSREVVGGWNFRGEIKDGEIFQPSFPPFCCLNRVTRWWQLKYFWNFHPENWGR